MSPSMPLKNWLRAGKMPQPGQAPWPGAMRLGLAASSQRAGLFTFSSPGLLVHRDLDQAGRHFLLGERRQHLLRLLSGSPGVTPW